MSATNIAWHKASVTRMRREELNQHKSIMLWFTGLSGAGKSTLATRWKSAFFRWVAEPLCSMATMFAMACAQTWAFQKKPERKISAAWDKPQSCSWRQGSWY